MAHLAPTGRVPEPTAGTHRAPTGSDQAGASVGHAIMSRPSVIVSRQGGLAAALSELWRFRWFALFFGRRLLERRYSRTWLGLLWVPLRPILNAATKLLVFGGVVGITAGKVPYPIYFLTASAAWGLFSECVLWSTRSLGLNRSLLRKLPVPRLVVIVSAIVPSLVDFLIGIALASVALLTYFVRTDHVYLDVKWLTPLCVLAAIALIALLGLGVGLITASAGARARDVRFGVTYVLGFMYFLTPVIYSFDQIPNRYKPIAELNPLTSPIELFKVGIFPGEQVSPKAIAVSVFAVLALWIPGLWLFQRRDADIAGNERRSLDRERIDLEDGVALQLDHVALAPTMAQQLRYQPAVSVFASLRSRWQSSLDDGDGGDDEDDLEDESARSNELAQELLDADAVLHDVSFSVRRGEAVAVATSSPSAARSLGRLLSGMTAPSGGRVIHSGRIGLGTEVGSLLIGRSTHPRGAARRLAPLAGVGLGHRRAWARELLQLAYGDRQEVVGDLRTPRKLLRHVPLAATLDPSADVLVIDELPGRADPGFRDRFLARLVERLDDGAAAVITASELEELAPLCTALVRIDDGVVVATDPAPEEPAAPPAATRERERPRRRRQPPPLRGFDEHAALLAIDLLGAERRVTGTLSQDDDFSVRVRFETTLSALVMVVVRFETAETYVSEKVKLPPGEYHAFLHLPKGTLEPGEWEASVGLVLEHDERTKVGRRSALRFIVDDSIESLRLTPAADVDLEPAHERGRPRLGEGAWVIEPITP